jgi:uncharacterized protein (DUF433 family)
MPRRGEHHRQAQRGMGLFTGTRTPVSTVFENLQDINVGELVEEFGVAREQVRAVLAFAAQSAETPLSPDISCQTL